MVLPSTDPILDWPLAYGFHNGEARADDGTRLRYVAGGPASGRRVVLLHGAPQFSYGWRHVMRLLAPRYRVIAPDLRGYGSSELSKSGRYDLDTLSGDVSAVLAATSRPNGAAAQPPILVAHDWGGPVAWRFLEKHGNEIRHFVAVNAPHPRAYLHELMRPHQAFRSWYVAAFQIPKLERLLDATDARPLLAMMTCSSPKGLFGPADLAIYRRALARPGRPAAVLAYYREAAATAQRDLEQERLEPIPRISTPITIVWGNADRALAPSHPAATRPYCMYLETRRLRGVSHWVPEERPEDVARAVTEGDDSA